MKQSRKLKFEAKNEVRTEEKYEANGNETKI